MGCFKQLVIMIGAMGIFASTAEADVMYEVTIPSLRFTVMDWVALLTYLLVIVGIGVYFAKREKTTEDYFLAGRRIPWWAATLSIFSTHLSKLFQ